MKKGDDTYTPLDEILDESATRVLRALRWFDWARTSDVFLALGAHDDERNALSATISRLVKEGLIERGERSREGYAHRLTPAGREELKQRLAGIGRMARANQKRRAA